jgi:2,4-dienoyl-CoA reductase-like NADH-dependent reductase (Old Yellow Enzyme family)
MNQLQQPIQIGDLTLNNRIAMAPITRAAPAPMACRWR